MSQILEEKTRICVPLITHWDQKCGSVEARTPRAPWYHPKLMYSRQRQGIGRFQADPEGFWWKKFKFHSKSASDLVPCGKHLSLGHLSSWRAKTLVGSPFVIGASDQSLRAEIRAQKTPDTFKLKTWDFWRAGLKFDTPIPFSSLVPHTYL